MRALIFTEGGSQIGLGHIYRCSSLYDELETRGFEVEFIIYGDVGNMDAIQNKRFKVANWLSTDFLNNHIEDNDYCIVDSYMAKEDLYKVVSKRARKCLFIDDYGRIKYPKSIVVNPSLSTDAVRYPESDTNCYLQGHKYIILRRPFIKVKRAAVHARVKEVLITLGGSDIQNLTPILLNQLSTRYPEIIFNVVIGNAFRNVTEIRDIKSDHIQFYENAAAIEMKSVMLKSDFAITAAGQTLFELIATQTPFIPIKVAENQSHNIAGLQEFDLVKRVLDSKDTLFNEQIVVEFEKMLEVSNRNELACTYKKVIDGLGAIRIIDALVAGDQERKVFLRKIREGDILDVFNLSNEDYVRKFSVNTKEISWEEHVFWFKNIIKSKNDVFYVVTDCTNQFLGQLRYNIESQSAKVSISLCNSITGKGLSNKLLKQSIELIMDERNELENINALVSDKNIASKKLFEKAGFLLCENNKGMLKYIYSINKGV